ncbi:MAG: BON domain-containing protein, partial [Nitrospirales bacterium]|nr:BON domain-containing protein [Nitrospirales bacterium]
FVDGDDVRVSVDNRVATLSGTVEDRSAMIDAVELAYDAGARKVRNKLSQRDRGERPWADMRDSELKEEIRDELDRSPFVNSDQISVSVRNGVATLSGGVENKGEIPDAVENAYEAGAKRVKSRLWVDPDL